MPRGVVGRIEVRADTVTDAPEKNILVRSADLEIVERIRR